MTRSLPFCAVLLLASAAGAQTPYAHRNPVFTVAVPAGYTVNEQYRYERLGPGKQVPGVALQVPKALTAGTNLAPDSYISVEYLEPGRPGQRCTMAQFLDNADLRKPLETKVSWEVATSGGAGAGNFYDETVHRDGCWAIRAFVHSTNIANYEPGKVREYDKARLQRDLRAVLESFTAGPN